MVNELQPAYILHRRPFSNSSLLLELLTRDHGRVQALARSARGPKSRFRGQLDLFIPLQLSLRGRRELKTLTQAEIGGVLPELNSDGLLCGFYINELILRLTHTEDTHTGLFELYQRILQQLCDKQDLSNSLRFFEKKLLQKIGYGLSLTHTASDEVIIETKQHYQYIHEKGFMLHHGLINENCFSGESLLALHHEKLQTTSHKQDAKRLLRLVLKYYLGDKPIKSSVLWH